jgi:eukaryotic-like serine/threonine-protein kinase
MIQKPGPSRSDGADALVGSETLVADAAPPASNAPASKAPAFDATLAPALAGTPSVEATLARGSLRETIGAPLPRVVGDAPSPQTLSTSVLPRVTHSGDVVRLVPSAGGERYKPIRRLGVGGMGEVALVKDRDIGRTVAIKRLLSPDQNPAMLARFIDEVHTVGGLEHPNIVPIHDVGVDRDGRYFFVMKYVDGETLEEIIGKLRAGDAEVHAKYPPRRRMEIFISVLRALQYAHDRNIIHRDLKPANIMIGRFGEVVLMDWGIARTIGTPDPRPTPEEEARAATASTDGELRVSQRASATIAGELIGTPMYMSPEQASGLNAEADARSDLFSACVLFHEFLCLRHRFEDVKELQALLTRVVTTEPVRGPKIFDPHPAQKEDIPYEMTHFLRRGLQLTPERRWQSAAEMIEELQAILDGRCRVDCATTLLKRTTSSVARFVDRYPGTAMLVMYGGTLALLVWLIRWAFA